MATAAPPAGTEILNQAGVRESAPFAGAEGWVLSNLVTAVVDPVEAFALHEDHADTAAAGQTVAFHHRIVNLGNSDAVVTVSVRNLDDDDFDFDGLDISGSDSSSPVRTDDGVVETQIPVALGGTTGFRVTARVPEGEPADLTGHLEVSAASAGGSVFRTNRNRVTVAAEAFLDLVKSASTPTARPGDTVVFTLEGRNVGQGPARGVLLTVDGAPATAVLVQDPVPHRMRFASVNHAGGGIPAYHVPGMDSLAFTTLLPEDPGEVDRVACLFPGLDPGDGFHMELAMTFDADAYCVVENVAEAAYDACREVPSRALSNVAVVELPVPPPSIAYFADGSFETPIRAGELGEPVFVQASAPGCDTDPEVVDEAIIVIVSDLTGDRETFTALETGPATGIFRIPGTVTTHDAAAKPAKENNGAIETLMRDVLRAEIQACAPHDPASADLYMEPFGVAFDTASDRPIEGVVITVVDAYTLAPATVYESDGVTPASHIAVTDAAGRYRFAMVAPGVCLILVEAPEGCVFPSQVPPGEMPHRLIDADASYGLIFAHDTFSPVWVDLPMDPVPAQGALVLEKSVRPETAAIGDFVDYTVTVRNDGDAAAVNVIVADHLPQGFVYRSRSARVNGGAIADPAGVGGPRLDFAVGDVAPGAAAVLTYRASLGAGAWGSDGVNRARAHTAGASSNTASARVRVERGVFTERGYLVGRVMMEPGAAGGAPLGIPGVRVLLENGTFSITDSDGQFSFYDLSPRTHAVKVDPHTLPPGARLVPVSQRHGGAGGSAFVDLKNGELFRTDFVAAHDPAVAAAIRARRLAAGEPEVERAAMELRPGAGAPRDERALPASGMLDADGGILRPAPVDRGLTARNSNLPPEPVLPLAVAPLESLLAGADAEPGFLNLADGDRLPALWTMVQVKGGAEGELEVLVNGEAVPASRLGKRVTDRGRGILAVEYVGVVLEPGENRLEVVQRDGFGNPRDAASIRVEAPGNLATLRLEPEAREIPADGDASVRFLLTLTDERGVPVTTRLPVTLETDLGRWSAADLDPEEPGTQVFVEGGAATFDLLAPVEPGESRVRAVSGMLGDEVTVSFVPELRPILGVGLVEGSIHLRDFSLDALVPARPEDDFEDVLRDAAWTSDDGDTRAQGRAAVYLKGKVRGSYLLTLAFDSERDQGARLFRDIRPDAFYPVYGSAGLRGFDARSTSRLYLRVDKGRSFLLFGDFVTDPIDARQNLGAYRRSLTGVKERYRADRVEVDAFVTHDDSRQVIEELEARGLSGPYTLRSREIVPNSETVEILVRDRNQPDVLLELERKTRFTDYVLDPWTGEILFRAPVPSLDRNLNPVSIRVTYESAGDAEKYWVGGVTASARVAPALEVGGSFVRDDNPAEDRTLVSGHATGRLGEGSTLTAEFARSRTLEHGEGDAGRLELRHRGGDLDARVFGARTDAAFDNPTASFSAGRTEAGGKATWRVASGTRLLGDAVYSEDRATGGSRRGAYLAVEQRVLDAVDVELGARHAEDDLAVASGGAAGPVENTTVRGRLGAQVPYVPRLHLSGSYEQDVSRADRRSAEVGGEYQILDRARLYLRHEFITSLQGPYALNGSRRHTTLVGLDAGYMRDGHAFSEYRARDAFHGRDAEAAIGLRNRWQVGRGLWLHTNFERVHSMSGDVDREATAVGGAVEVLRDPGLKATLRLEYRTARGADNVLATAGLARRLNRDWTLLARNVLSVDDAREPGGDRWRDRFQIGAAWRDLRTHTWNALTRYEFRYEDLGRNSGTARLVREHTASLHVNARFDSVWTWGGFHAAKHRGDVGNGVSSSAFTHLVSSRLHRDFARGWDAGILGSVLFSRGFDGRRYGLGAELGRMIATGLWASAGYNLFGFEDEELISETYTQRGAYLRLRWKFDESLFSGGAGDGSRDGSGGEERAR